ncbi:DNA polymerase III subunit gamma/tau [Helicobacter monodelphidis]|uniref:DNA polymerase III subunit gamma/tau n=1 Tax=Helicobacter sp. 15-1451 TaxID=2004995 RepID=UPI000DCBF004|nr:DNA polymerase III subunit gamma/tau [Helicobacter sp. 15-1451]RAX58628.1 DNA polymerase III subunit gamma/tau [Helicobacter sp. 15-1451]
MFTALAIKYRPSVFSELIGQDSISQTLSLALDSGRLGHAYLFSGLRGSGKTSSARIFAKSLNCDQGPTSTPCNECANCKAAANGRHLDIIEMDAASSRKIDDIRGIIEQTKYAPTMGRFKVFIIDEVHMLTRESYNALLKTLEEPPSYVKFILATTDVLKIPPTILSRSQHFRFKKIPPRIVLNHLINILNKENIPYKQDALEMIVRSGGGSLRDTLTLLDQAIIYSKNSIEAASVAQMLGILDPILLDSLFEALQKEDKENVFKIAEELESYECEMVLEEIANHLNESLRNGNNLFPLVTIDRFFRIITDSKQLLYLNANSSFVLTLSLLKMLEALKTMNIEEMIKNLEHEIFGKTNAIKAANSLPTPASYQESSSKNAKPTPIITLPVSEPENLFAQLKTKIYDRNFELGECFEKHIQFISFIDGVLSWQSSATGQCKERLKNSYSMIKHFVQEIYSKANNGQEVRIQLEQNDSSHTESTAQQEEFVSHPEKLIQKIDSSQQKEIDRLLNIPIVQAANQFLNIKDIVIKKGKLE